MPSLEKAVITNTVSGEQTPVMFNPHEYSLNKTINYAETAVPGLSAPILQFVNGNMRTLEMELFVDTYEETRDVRDETRKILDLMEIQPDTHAPPVLVFTWGSLSFTCVLANAAQRFVMFLPDGFPCRAHLQVTFNEFRNVDLEAKEIKRETADFSTLYRVSQGETLSQIAAREYGDSELWRPIALLNDIADPRSLRSGLELRIPRLPFRDPESGEVFE